MRITHIVLSCNAYNDYWNYQENCIPKYNRIAGHDVTVITVKESLDSGTGKYYIDPRDEYFDDNGVKVIRLHKILSQRSRLIYKLRIYKGLYECLIQENPDCIFVHGIQFLDILHVVKYAKRKKVKIVADCHEDFNNSAKNLFSRWLVHGILWKTCARLIEPYVSVFWGTLPVRCTFLKEVYGIPADKVKLLVMGAEDEKVQEALAERSIDRIRAEYGFGPNDFIVLSAGKLDGQKASVLDLMEAINEIEYDNIKFLFVGSIDDRFRSRFSNNLTNRVIYAGWQDSESLYKHMGAADLIVFPGSHSVLWEQAVALGKPCLFRKYQGIDHVDLGGNCLFLTENTRTEMERMIIDLYENRTKLDEMGRVAQAKGKIVFSYKNIAARSIEV